MKKTFLILTIILATLLTINVNAATNGWKTISGKKYYYENNTKVTGFKTINYKIYYFNKKGVLQKSKLLKIGKNYYYVKKDGSLHYGWGTVKKKKYYFDPMSGKAYKGYHEIGNNKYYFYQNNATLRIGFQKADGNLFYSDGNGVVQTGWKKIDGKTYYFRENYPYHAYKGYQNINGNLYYFYQKAHNLRIGFQQADGNTFYSNGQGIVQTGWQTINGRKYYFRENFPYHAYKGFKTMNEKTLFFDPSGRLVTGKQIVNGNEYYCTEEGEFIKRNFIPKYYTQVDKKWKNKKYGKYYFRSTGCSPTSLAMALQSILERQIKPTDVANYLYNKTNQFNRKLPGTSGKGIIYVGQHFNVKVVPITDIDTMKEYLQNGNILYAAMQNGKFATKDWNHAIILYRFDKNNNKTVALDPLKSSNNGIVDINLIWNQKSTDKDDLTGGSAIYALLPNN